MLTWKAWEIPRNGSAWLRNRNPSARDRGGRDHFAQHPERQVQWLRCGKR